MLKKQASKQAGKQAGRQAGRQAGTGKAFSQSHALEGLVCGTPKGAPSRKRICIDITYV